ncbi:MAG: hypothetical protein QOI66_3986 [Myxococcales bacterium]|jgi:hypothetical protein|nr:hypothetical protein [Myxococcales bacterium]
MSGRGVTLAVMASVAAATLALSGCAINVSETRSARVLRGGEMQLAEVNDIVIPTRAVNGVYDAGRKAAAAAGDRMLTQQERRDLTAAAAAIALTGPGYGAHVDLAVGLGYRYDLQARVGSGIYALSLRRGFDVGTWFAALGLRAAYNSGQTFAAYADDIADWVKISETRRLDGQLFGQLGTEWGEWGKFWVGAKGMASPLRTHIDTRRLGGDQEDISTTLYHAGGFVGLALGYRWIHFVAELSVLDAFGHVTAFGDEYDLSGVVIAPSWGFMGTF